MTALVAQLGCGAEAGHLNTFWVFVAGLLESDLCEELFCAIAETDMQTVTGSVHSSAPVSSAGRGDARVYVDEVTQDAKTKDEQDIGCSQTNDRTQPLSPYRFLLLLHCYNEVVMGGKSKSSACVSYIMGSRGVNLRTLYLRLPQTDMDVVAKMIQAHGNVVKRIDVALCFLVEHDLHRQFLQSLRHCVCLQKLSLGHPHLSPLFASSDLADCTMNISYVLSQNRRSLEVLDLSHIGIGSSGLHQLTSSMQQCHRLKQLLLKRCGLTVKSAQDLAAVVNGLPELTELSPEQNQLNPSDDSTFTASVIPALQNCKDMEKISLKGVGLSCYNDPKIMSTLGEMLASLPKLIELDLSGRRLSDSGFLHLAPALQQCSRLKCLMLMDSKLSSSRSMALLVSVLFCLPQLEEFAIGGNDIDDSHVNQLVMGLMDCSRLSKLNLFLRVQVNVLTQSLVALSHLIKGLHHLAELTLPGFTSIPGRSIGARLCRAVKGSSSLKTLVLPFGMCPRVVGELHGLVDDPTCALQIFAVDFV